MVEWIRRRNEDIGWSAISQRSDFVKAVKAESGTNYSDDVLGRGERVWKMLGWKRQADPNTVQKHASWIR